MFAGANFVRGAGIVGAVAASVLAAQTPAAEAAEDMQTAMPKGMVAFFNLEECPRGWDFYAGAEGRYVVGILQGSRSQQKESVGKTAGERLGDLENRSTGSHSHLLSGAVITGCSPGNPVNVQTGSCQPNDHGVSVVAGTAASSGGPDGTNAPYVQLLACEKK